MITIIFLTIPARSEIPFNHALGVYKSTKTEYKHISPFWGMVALEMLPNLRFFGHYETSTPLAGGRAKDRGKDAIAELILWLFPSPDGVQLVANQNNQDPVGDLSRKPERINGIIEALISDDSVDKKQANIIAELKIDPNTKNRNKIAFSDLLLTAYKQQEELANPEKQNNQLYPKDIVVIALLAFFAKVNDSKEDFKKLPLLMSSDFDATNKFGLTDYQENRNNTFSLTNHDDDNVEKAYLMAIGYEKYENLFAKPINYSAGVCFKNRQGFSDCGETSLRNILMLLLPREKKIIDSLELMAKKIEFTDKDLSPAPFEKVLTYFRVFPNLHEASQKKAHDAWAEVVSDLNLGERDRPLLEDVQYGVKEKGKNMPSSEIKANFSNVGVNGIINMLNVIAKILPDKKLNQLWPRLANSMDFDETKGFKLAAEKLTRFCEILSSEGHRVSWKNADTNDQTLRHHFPTITLSINKVSAYAWEFMPIHFQISLVASLKNDWRISLSNLPEKSFFNEWIASLYLRLEPNSFIEDPTLGSLYPRALIFGSHANLRDINNLMRTMSFILYRNMFFELQPFLPLLARFIEKSAYLDHEHLLKLISELLWASSKMENQNEFVTKLIKQFPKIDDKVEELVKNADLNLLASEMQRNREMMTALIFLNNDPRFNQLMPSPLINDTVLKNLTNLTNLNLGDNELITDDGIKNLSQLTSLNLSNNDKITDEGIKNLTALTSLNLTNTEKISNKVFKNLIELRSLNLTDNEEISDKGIENLKNPTKLIILNLATNDEISDDALQLLTNLADLDLTNNEMITDNGIQGLPEITRLNLARNPEITDEGIKNLKRLQSLDLSLNNRITNAGIENFPHLTDLNLAYNRKIDRLPNLVHLRNLDLTFNGLIGNSELKKLINLTHLNLASNPKITDAGIEDLMELISLNLDRNRNITDAGIQKLMKLTTLDLSGNQLITNAVLTKLPMLINIIRK